MSIPSLSLVVGMHRSGTSLLSGILQRIGVHLPGETIPGDTHNPVGYFEWNEIVAIQERLLIDLERWWPSADGVLPLPEGWLELPQTLRAYEQLCDLLLQDGCLRFPALAIKDPRSSLLLPLWKRVSLQLNFRLSLVLAVRDPSEVITSLVGRDGHIVGMTQSRAQYLWYRHNLEPLHFARLHQLEITVVDYSRWFLDPTSQLQELCEFFPSLSIDKSSFSSALSLINSDYRRSNLFPSSFQPSSSVRRLYRQLRVGKSPRRLPPLNSFFSSIHSLADNLPSDFDLWHDWLLAHASFPARQYSGTISLATNCIISVCGPSWLDVLPHLALQYLPVPSFLNTTIDFDHSSSHQLLLSCFCSDQSDDISIDFISDDTQLITLNLEFPETERVSDWLNHLRSQSLIFDPDPSRVCLMRRLGLPAWWLNCSIPVNDWLLLPQASDPRKWAAHLGLPSPPHEQVIVLGRLGSLFEQSLADEAYISSIPDQLPIAYFPGWHDLLISDPSDGLLLAGWLLAASKNSLRLFCAGVDSCPDSWSLLKPLLSSSALPTDIPTSELRDRHLQRLSMSLAEERAPSLSRTVRNWCLSDPHSHPPSVAVVISLYNYQDRIIDALDSVRSQSQTNLELIIVDDCSSDDGLSLVSDWIDDCIVNSTNIFSRILLLSHLENSGLAAARNTAFSRASSSWCFVLDADNTLCPSAVKDCLALVDNSDPHLAVVHPLLAVHVESGRSDDQRSLVRPQSWQRSRFQFENHIDAMALVRRSAWKHVGGYTHIEGGWEDYDFWCKLVSAGFYGIQCPYILAVYRSHDKSMSHCSTNRNWHALSRTLQQRHPWLQLPLASTDAI